MEQFLSHPVVAMVVLLGALVFFHELGHFLVGRLCGIAVEIFSIGFGTPLFKYRSGLTEYRVCLIPLGGYVKFYGAVPAEEVPDEVVGQEFWRANYSRRMLTVAAGPVANFILAVVAFAVLGGAGIPHPPSVLGDILVDSPAELAGLFPGDRLVAIDAKPVTRWRELEAAVSKSPGQQMIWTVERSGKQLSGEQRSGEQRSGERRDFALTPALVEVENMLGRKVKIGRAGVSLGIVPSFISVKSEDSWAARSGLRTGDLVETIQCGDDGEVQAPPGYGELIIALRKTIAECSTSIVFNIRRTDQALRLAAVKPSGSDVASARQDISNYGSVREFAKALGIEDGQLVITSGDEALPPGLRSGDRLTGFSGSPVASIFALRDLVLANQSDVVDLQVVRDFKSLTVAVKLKPVDAQKAEGRVTVYTLPFSFIAQPSEPAPVIEKYDGLWQSTKYGFEETGRQMVAITGALFHLVIGEIPIKALGGPIMIAKVAGDSAKLGWQAFLTSLALISVNLGLVNLIPIPVLDGGQMVLFTVERILRRPVSMRVMESFQKVGFIFIGALILLATYNDLSRFWKSMLAALVGNQ